MNHDDCTPPPESGAAPFRRTNCSPPHSGRNFSKRTFQSERGRLPATTRSPIKISRSFQIIRHHRRDHNWLGFSVQLCHLRFPGWPLKAGEAPAAKLLAYVERQLNVSPELFHDCARARDTTRREHLLELQRDFGFQPFTDLLSSKLGWEHINLTGDYIWDLRQTTTLQRLRSLRRSTLSVQDELESKAG